MIDSITAEEIIKYTETTGCKRVEGCSAKHLLVLFHRRKLGDRVVEAEKPISASLEGSYLNNSDKSFNLLTSPPSTI